MCRSCCWPYYLHNTLVCLCVGHVVGHISLCAGHVVGHISLCAGHVVGHISLCAGHVVGHIIYTTPLCACVQVMLLAISACVLVMLSAILSTQHPCVLVCWSCCWPYYLHNTLVCLCAGHVVGHSIYTTPLCACVLVMLLAILSTQHPCVLVLKPPSRGF